MMNKLVAIWIIFRLALTSLHAAPSIEACPQDSILSNDVCLCNPESCTKPLCQWNLKIAVNSSDIPGSCCPIYSCEGCKAESLIDGKCPCVPGAVINEKGICECVDKERHLVNEECVCNPEQCELPQICDRKSVLTTIEDGCCRKTRCLPCPEDSESTNLESDDIEDHCVCLPCKNDCGLNKTIVVKKKGTSFPGNCCDLYECKPLDENDKDCVVGDIIYANGEEWSTDDKQECKCENGLSMCGKPRERDGPLNCIDDDIIYRHKETWLKDDGCTNCTCINGDQKCISHYCHVKESQVNENSSSMICYLKNKVVAHLEMWIESDDCTECVCVNGEVKCNTKACKNKELPKKGECQPLFNCNKQCSNGFRINKKGCEICKCNSPKVSHDLLTKYNITMDDLINILDEYVKNKDLTTTTSSSPASTASTTSITTTTTPAPPILVIRRNGNEDVTSSTETLITPACAPENCGTCWTIPTLCLLGIIGAAVMIVAGVIIGVWRCINKRNDSTDITSPRGSYYLVHNPSLDNNYNTIKRSSIAYN